MPRASEALMSADMVLRVLAQAGPELVLVGGQALAFWMNRYRVGVADAGIAAITRDVDFLGADAADASPLRRFAAAIGGRAEVLAPAAISALVGSAFAPADDGRIYNVDLLHRVVGLERDEVADRALTVHLPGLAAPIRVMHPLHVLRSRNANLHTLAEKQDDMGRLQFRLAIDVARAFLEDEIDDIETAPGPDGQREALQAIRPVLDYAKESAAKKNAERHGIHLADAIPAWRIVAPVFWEKQWPHVRELMSPGQAGVCEVRRAV